MRGGKEGSGKEKEKRKGASNVKGVEIQLAHERRELRVAK